MPPAGAIPDDAGRRSFLRAITKAVISRTQSPRLPLETQRRMAALTSRAALVPRLGILRMALDSVPCELLLPPRAVAARTILYLHGGGYVIGSARGHRALTAGLAQATGAPVFAPDYRLAPEHPFPAALQDVVSAYRHLLAGGRQGSQIVMAGDGAGSGLVLAAAHALRDVGLPLPAGLVLISPWLDLTLSGDSIVGQAKADPLLSRRKLACWADHYRGELSGDHPGCSPLFGDHRGLPPILVQVGTDEILRSDAERLARHATAIEVQSFDGLWHAFQIHAGVLPSADEALGRIAAFADRAWTEPVPPLRRKESTS